jgi:endonuclease YncB( thermonuclease family)
MSTRRHLTAALSAAAAAMALAPAALPAPVPATGVVTAVVDGDTLRVRQGQAIRTVDLAGVDAPERGQCFAVAATRRLKASVAVGGTVRLAFPGRRPGARAKRFAALVRVDGLLLNRRMVIGGFARTDGADLFRAGRVLVDAEVAAQDAARGLWRVCEGFTPSGGDAGGTPAGSPPPATPAAPTIPSTPVPDAELRARFNELLKGRAVLRETSDAFSLTQRKINFCSDGTYREVVNTIFGSSGGATLDTTDGRWTIARTGSGTTPVAFTAAIIALDADGTADDREIEIDRLTDDSILLDGRTATLDVNTECA